MSVCNIILWLQERWYHIRLSLSLAFNLLSLSSSFTSNFLVSTCSIGQFCPSRHGGKGVNRVVDTLHKSSKENGPSPVQPTYRLFNNDSAYHDELVCDCSFPPPSQDRVHPILSRIQSIRSLTPKSFWRIHGLILMHFWTWLSDSLVGMQPRVRFHAHQPLLSSSWSCHQCSSAQLLS